jgi:hypothetical protein
MVAYGSNGGVVGCGGPPMTRLLGPYSTFAGVHGTARDFTGVAGTSVNGVGVYGQVEELKVVFLPTGLHAGVLGMALTQPGVIAISESGNGVEASSFNKHGVIGTSTIFHGVNGLSEIENASSAFPAGKGR